MAAALVACRTQRMGVRRAAEQFSVPRSTLSDKLLGKTPEQRKCGPDTVLTSQVHVFAQYSFTYKYRDLGLTTNPAYYNAAVVA